MILKLILELQNDFEVNFGVIFFITLKTFKLPNACRSKLHFEVSRYSESFITTRFLQISFEPFII